MALKVALQQKNKLNFKIHLKLYQFQQHIDKVLFGSLQASSPTKSGILLKH